VIKETLVLAALAISSPTVIDGDTVRTAGISIRLTDYDSPELFHPKCPREYQLAYQAKLELERIIGRVKLRIKPAPTLFAADSRACRLCRDNAACWRSS